MGLRMGLGCFFLLAMEYGVLQMGKMGKSTQRPCNLGILGKVKKKYAYITREKISTVTLVWGHPQCVYKIVLVPPGFIHVCFSVVCSSPSLLYCSS